MILHLTTGDGRPYLIAHDYIADISGLRQTTDYGANSIVRDRGNGTHWVADTVEEIAAMIASATVLPGPGQA